MTVSQGIARFSLHFDRSAHDSTLQSAATAAIVDGLAALVGGVREDFGRTLHSYARAQHDGAGTAIVIGSHLRAAPAFAAYINAAAGHSLCYDDTSNAMMGHPTIVVLPAVLATGEFVGCSGSQLIDAYVVGVEVAVRVSAALAPGHYQRGWHATGTAGVIGAAAAAARLLGLQEDAATHAIGIAATSAAGLRANFGTMAMIYHAGLAARGGVDAAFLARDGMTSAAEPFTGRIGYFAMFSGSLSESVDAERVVGSLGAPFELVSPGLDVKPFPCGSLSHRAIQAVLELKQEHSLDARDVVEISCTLPELHQGVLVNQHPDNVLGARISLTYPVAVAMRNGSCGVSDFSMALIQDPEIRRLIDLVRVSTLPTPARRGEDLFAAPAEVAVRLRDGRKFWRRVEIVKGSPMDPLRPDEVATKFSSCVEPILGPDLSKRVWDAAWHLETLADIRELTSALASIRSI